MSSNVDARRFVCVQFCDDIRQEVGNKVSLMGCYGPSMLFPKFPALLPKLCVHIKVYTPIQQPLGKLVLRLLRADQVIVEMPVPANVIASPEGVQIPPGADWQMVVGALVISPFHVEEPCVLRVEAETEDGVLNGGIFQVTTAPVATKH